MRHNREQEVISSQQLFETKRSNLAREQETNRSNLAKEVEATRSNVAKENETKRHNKATETLSGIDTGSRIITGIAKLAGTAAALFI